MEYSLQEKYDLIRKDIVGCGSSDPVAIARSIMDKVYVSMHGPEHHFLGGAAFLVAYKNAAGESVSEREIDELAERTRTMPGAMCGYWGVCGSVAAVGAALSVLHGTGPLSTDQYYQDHMKFTSRVLARMSEIGGARCCKRNAFLSLSCGAEFVRETYGIPMQVQAIVCDYSPKNRQCIGERCPFHRMKDTEGGNADFSES